MLSPSQFGAIQTPPMTAWGVRKAIQAGRIHPKPKWTRMADGRRLHLIHPSATIDPPKLPGRKPKETK